MRDTLLADSLALIQERGVIRCAAIAELLNCTSANVQFTLQPRVDAGELITCAVEVGGEKLVEYRYSAAGGGKVQDFRPYRSPPELRKPPTPVTEAKPRPLGSVVIAVESSFGTESGETGRSPTRRFSIPLKEDSFMTTADKCEAAFKKHGPMTTRALREHVKGDKVSYIVASCGRFAKLGGGFGSTIWGLPDQQAPKSDGVDIDRVPKHLHKKAGKKKAAGGGMPRKQRKPARDVQVRQPPLRAARIVAGAFRPAIAHDGALLLTGAAQQGELNSAETRVLADFLARVDRTGVRA